jgi:2-oxoglutarate dehydrogenase E2 component (dihydrolipoamide succinyltransferase)
MGQSTFERDRRGFKELAKLAGPQSRPKASSISGVRRATVPDENDSGMVDLEALASSDPGAVDRASVTPLASATLFEDEVAKAPASFPSGRLSAPSAPPAPPSVRPQVQAAPAVPVARTSSRPIASAQATLRSGSVAPARRSVMVPITATVVGLAAIAAGAFFVVRSVRAPVAASPVVNVAAQAAVTAPQPTPAATVAEAQTPTAPADRAVDPLTLPVQTVETAAHHATHAWRNQHASQALVAKADPKEADDEVAAPAAKAAPPPAKDAPAAPAPAANNTLLNMIAQSASTPAAPAAAPAAEAAPVPAAATVSAGSGSGLAPRPSQGQVTTALGAALPGARACLNDDDGVSRAHVVFGSDGAVQSVAVTGFATGKPAEGCIKTALGKAHVPAFAEASYGATVTVRP